MIAIIAPARNTRPVQTTAALTCPLFWRQAQQLAKCLQSYSPWQLESLLEVPAERALQLYDAYKEFNTQKPQSAAILSYYGAAYRNMEPQAFSADQLAFAQRHLRILSALYGLLRPLDGILPHRLGLTKAFRPKGQDLYTFWGNKVYDALFQNTNAVINLASVEYAKLVTPYLQPKNSMIHCRFLVQKPAGVTATAATVRAARGKMVKFMVENKLTQPHQLQAFAADGYRFSVPLSRPDEYVFVKPHRTLAGLYGPE